MTANFRHVYSSPINLVPALGKTAIKDVGTIRRLKFPKNVAAEKFRFYQRHY